MKPTRRTQPYREGAREPGPALDAMLRGRTLHGHNPMDAMRNPAAPQADGDGRPTRRARAARRDRPPRQFRPRSR